ncbi:uncharacterized protein BKA55DRAFT_564919 [Fusarium redolens]|uniref:Secreted protein n=1 Tax=Fusarium redolens TaxID=48865 RepID=A0A9P9HDZ0_FUSRE|nr:uncharacterized protein BKA55DRAFT_564919 [Fusarium redolens]KAH7255736.1 hypothetical protein BKA55DRAFT_564919 [Fusarium redolens]
MPLGFVCLLSLFKLQALLFVKIKKSSLGYYGTTHHISWSQGLPTETLAYHFPLLEPTFPIAGCIRDGSTPTWTSSISPSSITAPPSDHSHSSLDLSNDRKAQVPGR